MAARGVLASSRLLAARYCITKRARETVTVELAFNDVVLSAMPQCGIRETLVVRPRQHQHGDLRGVQPDGRKRPDAIAVRQREVKQYDVESARAEEIQCPHQGSGLSVLRKQNRRRVAASSSQVEPTPRYLRLKGL
jgi:hypothetical protein